MDPVVSSTSMVWSIILRDLRPYVGFSDMVHLLFTSKAFLKDHYRDYRSKRKGKDLIYDLYHRIDFCRLHERNNPSTKKFQMTWRKLDWFMHMLYATDRAYLKESSGVERYWIYLPSHICRKSRVWKHRKDRKRLKKTIKDIACT